MALLLNTHAQKIEIEPRDWPRCGKCRMPIEEFCIYDTPDAMIIEAQCHGKYEAVNIPNEVLASTIGSLYTIESVFTEEI